MAIRSFLHHAPDIGEGAYVDPLASIIGQVTLGQDASVWPFVIARGDLLPITVGRGSNIQDGSVLHTTQDSPYNPGGFALRIGDFVTVGHNATLHGCTIHDYAMIGMGAIILDGATIETDAMVAAGSLIPPGKCCKSGELWMGNPAKMARMLSPKEIEFFRWNTKKYIALKNQYLLEGS